MQTILQVSRKRYSLLVLAITFTVVVRLVYGLVIFDRIADRFSWRLDDEYSDIAHTLITSEKYALSETSPPTMRRLPIHPLVLASIYAVFGESITAVRILQSLLCGLTCVMVFLTAREVTNNRVAGIACLLFAFYPNSILYSPRTLSETTYAFLLSVFAFMVVRQFRSRTIRSAIATGLSFGLLTLTKGTTVLLPAFLVLSVLSTHYREGLRWVVRGIVVMVLAAGVVMSPWVIRNHRLTGKIIVLSTWGGVPFYNGFYVATHVWDKPSDARLDREAVQEVKSLIDERYIPSGHPIDEYYRDRIAYRLVWEKIVTKPLNSIRIFLRSAFLTWFQTYEHTTTIISFFVHLPLLLFAGYAVYLMGKQDPQAAAKTLPLLLVVVYFNLFHAVVYPHVRYMSPVIGTIVAILAAYGVWQAISNTRHLWSQYLGRYPQEAGS